MTIYPFLVFPWSQKLAPIRMADRLSSPSGDLSVKLEVTPNSGRYRSALVIITIRNETQRPIVSTDVIAHGRGLGISMTGEGSEVSLLRTLRGDIPLISQSSFFVLEAGADFVLCFRWSAIFNDMQYGPSKSFPRKCMIKATYDLRGEEPPEMAGALPLIGPVPSNEVTVFLSPGLVQIKR